MAATLGTGPQRLVIRIIGRFPSIHARQLGDILHLHPSSLTAPLKRLERAVWSADGPTNAIGVGGSWD